METLPFFLVAFLALCWMPSVLSLQCYECTNSPGFVGVTTCDSDEVSKRTCDQLSDRCMTMRYNFSLGGLGLIAVVMKNCSSSLGCNPQFEYNWCKTFELTGLVSNCSLACCQGDLCNGLNPIKPTSTPTGKPTSEPTIIPTSIPASKPTSSGPGFSAGFGAIFAVLVATAFVGLN